VTWECCEWVAIPTEYDNTHYWKPIELQVFCVAQEFPIITPPPTYIHTNTHSTRYEVLSSSATKNVVLACDTMQTDKKFFLRFRESCWFHPLGREKKFFYPKDEDNRLARNVINFLQDCTESHRTHNNIWHGTTNNILPPASNKQIKLLNLTGYVMHQQFNIQQMYALPTLYLCVLYLSENKQRLVPLTA